MATMQLEKIASRSNSGSTASDGWLWYPFGSSFSLGSQYVLEWIYVRFTGLKSASGAFTGDVPIQIVTTEGDYDVGVISGYTFPASTSSSGVQISGYLATSADVLAKLTTATIERVDLGQSTYAGGKDIRCLESSQCTLILGYNYAYSKCYWSSDAKVILSETLSRNNVTLSWSGAIAGTVNPITGYEVQYCESSNGSTWGDWMVCSDSPTNETSLSVAPSSTAGNYRKFRVRIQGEAGLNYYSDWLESSNMLRRDHAGFGAFTDPTLTVGTTKIKAVHMTELQDRVNTLRTFYGLSKYSFTTITAGTTSLAGWTSHVNQIRTAIEEVCTASGKTHAAWISFSVNCPRADVIQQMRDIVLAL